MASALGLLDLPLVVVLLIFDQVSNVHMQHVTHNQPTQLSDKSS
jgi:hypothetical protein